MQALPRCPSCRHEEWVRANIVVVPGAQGPLRVSTSYVHGPANWTCANCGYVDPCGGEIEGLLDRVPEHVSGQPATASSVAEGQAPDGASVQVADRGDDLCRRRQLEPGQVRGNDMVVDLVNRAVGRTTADARLLRIPRRAPSLGELSIHDLIVRIRWERAKREALEPGSPAYLEVGESEARLIRELHHRFGVENIAASDLEWYVRVDRDRRPHRVPTESA
jgi:hypothetical protein